MTIEEIAAELRQAFANHEGKSHTLIPWEQADELKKDGWRAIARRAAELFGGK